MRALGLCLETGREKCGQWGKMPGPELQMLRSEVSSYGPVMGWAESQAVAGLWEAGGSAVGRLR